MTNYEDDFNRHSRRAYNKRMGRLISIRAKLGRLSLMPLLSPLTTSFSVAFVANRKKMVAAAYKAWHKGYLSDKQLEYVKENAV